MRGRKGKRKGRKGYTWVRREKKDRKGKEEMKRKEEKKEKSGKK